MKVDILDITENPVEVISMSAGKCYGKTNSSVSRVKNAHAAGHMSVFEHAKVTVQIDGISRTCANQLTRHRMASFCQESQRYVKIDTNSTDWYVTPPAFDDKMIETSIFDSTTLRWVFDVAMEQAAEDYNYALEHGVRAEDARFLLPGACKTSLVMTVNLRELYHIIALRDSQAAQWEIRELVQEIERVLKSYNDEWKFLMELEPKE